MQDSKKLSSEVKVYPCRYDNSSPTCKEKIPKKYAWARIDDWASLD